MEGFPLLEISYFCGWPQDGKHLSWKCSIGEIFGEAGKFLKLDVLKILLCCKHTSTQEISPNCRVKLAIISKLDFEWILLCSPCWKTQLKIFGTQTKFRWSKVPENSYVQCNIPWSLVNTARDALSPQ